MKKARRSQNKLLLRSLNHARWTDTTFAQDSPPSQIAELEKKNTQQVCHFALQKRPSIRRLNELASLYGKQLFIAVASVTLVKVGSLLALFGNGNFNEEHHTVKVVRKS
uniref:Uncharacterized protein n=1 Tax=Anopheles culicifacies TaxID=139723 RepID=A0A182M666_9DIPT